MSGKFFNVILNFGNFDHVDMPPLNSQTKILRFVHSAKKDAIFPVFAVVFSTFLVSVLHREKWHKLYPTPEPALIILSVLITYVLILVAWAQIQRVEIDSERRTVRFANSHTLHRWQSFSIHDAISIRAQYGIKGRPGILIGLTTPSGTTPEYIYLDNLDGPPSSDPIDSALFLALVNEIRCVHPAMKIGIPQGYRGSLAKELCELRET